MYNPNLPNLILRFYCFGQPLQFLNLLVFLLVKDSLKAATEENALHAWQNLPSVLANVVSFEPPGPSCTPWLKKLSHSKLSASTPTLSTPLPSTPSPSTLLPSFFPSPSTPLPSFFSTHQSSSPSPASTEAPSPSTKDQPSSSSTDQPIKIKIDPKRRKFPSDKKARRRRGQKKLTRGQANRKRRGPQDKRLVLMALKEMRDKHGQHNSQHNRFAREDGVILIEFIANLHNVPVSNLRSWEKKRETIYKDAGQLEAAEIMGVKQRRMAVKVKNMLRDRDSTLKPLTDHMKQDIPPKLLSSQIFLFEF